MSRYIINAAFGFDVFELPSIIDSKYDVNGWLAANGYPDVIAAESNDSDGWIVFVAKNTWIELFDSNDHCNSELRYISQPTDAEREQLRRLQTTLRESGAEPGPIGFVGLNDVS